MSYLAVFVASLVGLAAAAAPLLLGPLNVGRDGYRE